MLFLLGCGSPPLEGGSPEFLQKATQPAKPILQGPRNPISPSPHNSCKHRPLFQISQPPHLERLSALFRLPLPPGSSPLSLLLRTTGYGNSGRTSVLSRQNAQQLFNVNQSGARPIATQVVNNKQTVQMMISAHMLLRSRLHHSCLIHGAVSRVRTAPELV